MVKHPKSYGARVAAGARRAIRYEVAQTGRRICSEFRAPRMEEFIVGKEFNVLVVAMPRLGQPMRIPG